MATLPATTLGQAAWHHLVHGGWNEIAGRYVFDTRAPDIDRYLRVISTHCRERLNRLGADPDGRDHTRVAQHGNRR